mmetsp:Transcript_31613/g.100365  ORF Transcript_31613/g.100365 Transcript_31613/m.100365 type:complete len:204 (-) Transcript_31613:212-823(-)
MSRTSREDLGAYIANVHGGVDWWSKDEAVDFFKAAVALDAGIPVAHETHRMRALSTPMMTQRVLRSAPGVRLTADLSHWVVGAERTFDFPSDAGWWPALLDDVAAATTLTHARVGAPREIQVADPAAPEHAALLEAYEAWWSVLWAAQAAREGVVRIEAEFGPAPYMPALPYTEAPVADLERVVDFITRRQHGRLVADGVCQA